MRNHAGKSSWRFYLDSITNLGNNVISDRFGKRKEEMTIKSEFLDGNFAAEMGGGMVEYLTNWNFSLNNSISFNICLSSWPKDPEEKKKTNYIQWLLSNTSCLQRKNDTAWLRLFCTFFIRSRLSNCMLSLCKMF